MSDVILRERAVGDLRQLSGWRDSFDASAGAAMRALGFAGVGAYGVSQVAGKAVAFRVAPERVWIRTPDAKVWEKAAAKADFSLAPVLELTGSRRLFAFCGKEGVEGEAEGVEMVLSRLAAVDFSRGVFAVGSFAQAECLGSGVLFHRTGLAEFEVYVSRSWGESFRESAEVAGALSSGAE